MSRTIAHDTDESRKERARQRRKAFRSVNLAWAFGCISDQEHTKARRRMKMDYKL